MQLGSVSSIASNGLRVQSDRLATSAQNTANVNTPGYTSDRVTLRSRAEGGVSSQVSTYDRRGGLASASGQQASSSNDVDLAQERVDQLSSQRAFEANVAVLHTSDQMVGDLLRQKA